jgi:exonuclease SbcC
MWKGKSCWDCSNKTEKPSHHGDTESRSHGENRFKSFLKDEIKEIGFLTPCLSDSMVQRIKVFMQILSIHLKNIKSHRDTELSFSAGINVLSGPNGAGKSTIFEAIGYALFGVDARDFVTNVDRFLSIGSKKGEISVAFRTDYEETWRVTRTVGTPAKWLLAKESGGIFEVEEHAGIEETEARIAELLGLNNGRPLAEQFKLVIGPFQNDFLGPFVIKQVTRRQEAFDEILGIDAWRKTYKGTSSLISAIQMKIEVMVAEVQAKQEQVAILPEREVELEGIKANLATRKTDLKERETALNSATDKLKNLDLLKVQLDKAENEVKQTTASIESGKEHITSQKVLVGQSEAAVKTMEQSRPGKEAFEKAEARLADLRKKEKERRAIEIEVLALEKDAQRLTQEHDHEVRETGKTEKDLVDEEKLLAEARKTLHPDENLVATAGRLPDLRKEVDRAKGERSLLDGRRAALLEGRDKLAEGICPFFLEPCRNVAGKEPRDVFSGKLEDIDRAMRELEELIRKLGSEVLIVEKAQKELDAFKVRGEELDKRQLALQERRRKNNLRADNLGKLKERLAEADLKAGTRRGDLQAFTKLDEEISLTEMEKNRHQADRDVFHTSLKDADDLENRRQTLAKYEKRLEVLHMELSARQAEMKRLGETYIPEQHAEARRQKDTLVAEVATLTQQLVAMERDRHRIEEEIGRLKLVKAEIEKKLSEKKVFEEKEKLVKFLRNQVFKNVSAQLSERFREEISLRADRIYRTIAEADEELSWGENYQILLRDMADGAVRERSDDQLSGGQTMSAVVALRLALLQTIGARIAFFDEPTSNLDASRRENLAHAFRAIDVGREEVTEHWYDQLFLVSHDVAFTEITDQIIHLGE